MAKTLNKKQQKAYEKAKKAQDKKLKRQAEDPVARERVDERGNTQTSNWENLMDRIKGIDPAVLSAGAGAVASASQGMEAKDVIKIAAVAFVAYKLYESHKNKQTQKSSMSDEDYSKMCEEIYGTPNGDKVREDAVKNLYNPTGVYSQDGSYRASDVMNRMAEVSPYTETEAYKNLTKAEKKEFDTYQDRASLHRANYDLAFAENGASMQDCRYFDFDGKEFQPFESYSADAPAEDVARVTAVNAFAKDALIYGMDSGQITCKLPNGETFNPLENPLIKNDAYTKHRVEMNESLNKYADVDAQIRSEQYDKMHSLTDLEKAEFVPSFVSENDKSAFVNDALLHTYAQREYATAAATLVNANDHPYEAFLDAKGARVADFSEIKQRADADFAKAHPHMAKAKSKIDAMKNAWSAGDDTPEQTVEDGPDFA